VSSSRPLLVRVCVLTDFPYSIGQNPTGATLSMERRKAIYELCDVHDILIIEDDPYWYLQFTPESHPSTSSTKTKYPFLDALMPSFLTIDVSGRVLRLDTFSKTIAPGCRLGWITAQPAFCERILRVTESSTQQPSGYVQSMVAQLLLKNWGLDGWVTWLESLRDAYEARMEAMCVELEAGSAVIEMRDTREDEGEGAAVEIRKKALYSFVKPDGGMFVWVQMHIADHPSFEQYVSKHSKLEMMQKLWEFVAAEQKTLPAPGSMFAPNEEIEERSACEFFRFCFAAIELEQVKVGTRRFSEGVRKFWKLSVEEIERIGIEEEGGGGGLGDLSEAFRFTGIGC
jgi:DNA-binding transcriptional MocR family regulator